MRCPKCNVEVTARATVCPLCHGNLVSAADTLVQNDAAPLLFPEYNRYTPLSNPIADKLYVVFAVLMSIAAIIINALTFDGSVWSPFAAVAFFYGYFLIRHTLMDAKNFCAKLLFQVFLMSILLFCLQIFLLPNLVVVLYVVPALHVTAEIAMVFYLLIMWRRPRTFLIPLLSVAIISVTPFLFSFAFGNDNWEFSLICAGLGLIIALVSAIAYRKLLHRELVRFFHI